jgi:glycosyltransferase involved in cell wall biosynthesis
MGGSEWVAGPVYLENLIRALQLLGKERPDIFMLVDDPAECEWYDTIREHLSGFLVNPAHARAIERESSNGSTLADTVRTNAIDCVFGLGSLGSDFPIPVMSWLFDFQHVHLAAMFSDEERVARDQFFADTARDATRVILSSRDAFEDFARIFPAESGKARVLSPVAWIDVHNLKGEPTQLLKIYNLPQKFMLLPAQFWKHKNHVVVLEAVARAREKAADVFLVCTGNTRDYRHPQYFEELLQLTSRLGLRNHIAYLGQLPRAHMLQLMRHAVCLVQPSLFEGWSTIVEEGKALNKTMLLSGIGVHREQAPDRGWYFVPDDVGGLADLMVRATRELPSGCDVTAERAGLEAARKRSLVLAERFVALAAEIVTH